MKILKSNTKQIFDTDNINFMENYDLNNPINISNSLLQTHELTDYEFLRRYIPVNHHIFNDHSKSFFWIIYKDIIPAENENRKEFRIKEKVLSI